MSWDFQGKRVTGLYMGKYSYSGIVESSRVKYGGSVQHTVVLDAPIIVFGAVRQRILVDANEVDSAQAVYEGFYDVGGMTYDEVRRMCRE